MAFKPASEQTECPLCAVSFNNHIYRSRESSQAWVKKLGADHVVDYTQALQPQIEALIENQGIGPVTHVASLNGTDAYNR